MQIRQLKITNFRGITSPVMRFSAMALVLLTLCAVSFFPEPVFAQQPVDSADPLTAEEMIAITKEADERRQKFPDNREEPLAPPWKNLTRDKLAKLIASPQFQKVPHFSAHGLLMDQALAWDLVHFQNLSDIKQFFQMVNGKRYFPEPDPSERSIDSSRIGYVSEASASPEGGALSALAHCTPWAMWVFESQDPVLWALKHYTSLQEIADFGWCVRKQRDGWPTPKSSDPDSARGAKSAVIIEDRLSRQLLNHGCSGTGPDQCLGLLLILQSLKPNHPDLAAILRRLDVETEATRPEEIPTGLTGVQGLPHDFLNAQYEKIQQRLWRKGIVLSAKLDHMLSHPQEWTKTEIEHGVDAAVSLMLEGGRISFLKFPYRYLSDRYIAHPWDHLKVQGAMPAIVAQRLQQFARQAGAQPGCEFGKLAPYSPLPEYWYSYALTKLQRENQECSALPLDWVAAQYISASSKSQRELLDPIAALAPWLSESAEPIVRDAVLSRIENHCPATNWGADYWEICSRHAAAIEAENKRKTAAEAAQREAQERKAQALQNDPCTNGTVEALLLTFGYGDAEDIPTNGTRVSCKQLPNVPGSAAVAVFHLTHPDNPNDPSDNNGVYDLHLILTDNKGGIKAQVHEKKAAHSDAVRLDNVAIDSGLYILAPKVRAIGVSTYNAAHCYECVYSETNLSLFVQSGKKLRKVWSGLLHSSGNDDAPTNEGCTSPIMETRKYFSMSNSTHFGYADLVITTVTSSTAGYNRENENQVCSGGAPKQRSTETWIYDGSKYMLANKKSQKK